jgi:hypothetical protein
VEGKYFQALETNESSLARDFAKLVNKATKTTSSKKWCSISIDGLAKVIENVGKAWELV